MLDANFRERPSLLKKSVEGLWMDLNRVQRPKKWCHRGQKEAQKRVPESFSTRSGVLGSPYPGSCIAAVQCPMPRGPRPLLCTHKSPIIPRDRPYPAASPSPSGPPESGPRGGTCVPCHVCTMSTKTQASQGGPMTDKKVWFITGAGRGMGVDIAKATLDAGNAVVATGRRPEAVEQALGGAQDDLLVVKLDVTSPADAQAAVQAAVERFGRIDVLVNNAGNFYAGFFEEISPEDFRAQIETTLFGPLNVTRAVLPVMRAQRSGLVVAISSTAGIVGQEFCTAYAASKFGVEGWIESLTPEVAPFGIRTMLVEPGFFRTELLTPESTNYA